jgi:hypothetical protein
MHRAAPLWLKPASSNPSVPAEKDADTTPLID